MPEISAVNVTITRNCANVGLFITIIYITDLSRIDFKCLYSDMLQSCLLMCGTHNKTVHQILPEVY
jgi:hypothetical protein